MFDATYVAEIFYLPLKLSKMEQWSGESSEEPEAREQENIENEGVFWNDFPVSILQLVCFVFCFFAAFNRDFFFLFYFDKFLNFLLSILFEDNSSLEMIEPAEISLQRLNVYTQHFSTLFFFS